MNHFFLGMGRRISGNKQNDFHGSVSANIRYVLLQLFSATQTRIPVKNAVSILGMCLNTAR